MTSLRKFQLLGGASVLALAALVPVSEANAVGTEVVTNTDVTGAASTSYSVASGVSATSLSVASGVSIGEGTNTAIYGVAGGHITTVTNAGTINGGTAFAINFMTLAAAVTINNATATTGAVIKATSTSDTINIVRTTGDVALTINQGNVGGTLSGTISNTGTGDAIDITQNATVAGTTMTIANNSGTISAAGSTANAISISVLAAAATSTQTILITNGSSSGGSGTISAAGTGAASAISIASNISTAQTVTITNAKGIISAAGSTGAILYTSTGAFTSAGTITINNGVSGNSAIGASIVNTGTGANSNAIRIDTVVTYAGELVINNYEGGEIRAASNGSAAAIYIGIRSTTASTTITNKGTITGGGSGSSRIAIDGSANPGSQTVVNSGTINGDIKFGGGAGQGVLTLNNGTVTGAITTATTAGVVVGFATASSSTGAAIVGNVGTATNMISTMTVGASFAASITGSVYVSSTLTIGSASSVTINGDNTVTIGEIAGAAAGNGTLSISGTTTVTNAIGANNKIGTLAVTGAGKTVTLSGSVTADSLVFSADELVNLASTKSITVSSLGVSTATNNTGSLTIVGTGSTVTGDVGSTTKMLKTFSTGGAQVEVVGNLYATTVALTADGNLTISSGKTLGGGASVSSVTSSTGTTTAGIGILTFSNAASTSALAANVGTTTAYVKKVDVIGNGAGTLAVATNVKVYSQNGIQITDQAAGNALTFAGGNTVVSSSGTAALKDVETNNQTALTFTAGTNQITGDVGAAASAFKTLTVTAGTTTITGSAYFGTTASLTGALSISGDLTGTATTINSGGALTMTGSGKTHTGTLTVASGGTFTPGATTTVTGAFANSGTVALGSNTVTVQGAITGTSGIYTTTVTSTTSGRILATSATAPVFTTAMTITPTLSGTAAVAGRKYLLFKNTGTGASVANITLRNAGSGLVNWTVATGGTGTDADGTTAIATSDIYMTATVTDATTLTGVTKSAGSTINPLVNYTGNDSNMIALQNAIQALTTASEVNTAGEKLRPNTNGATTQASVAAGSAVSSVVATRMDSVRVAHANTGASGMNSGDAARGIGVWGQAFGYTGDQGTRSGSDGYDAQTAGMAFGVDAQVIAPVRVGMSFAYGTTGVDDKGTRNGNSTDIDSYLATVYGSYTGTPWYVEGMIQGGKHNYDSTRKVAFTGISQTINGKHDASQYGGRIGAGYPVRVQNMTITPVASLTYLRLDEAGYTETGGSTALRLNSLSTDSLKSSLGAKFSLETKAGSATLIPEVRANWIHEFDDGAPTQTAAFAAGGSSFTTTGVGPAANAINLGLGLTAALKNNLSLSANYDAELKDQYVGHTGSLQLRADF